MTYIIVIRHIAEQERTYYFTLKGFTADRAEAGTFEDRDLAEGVARRFNLAYVTLHAHVEQKGDC